MRIVPTGSTSTSSDYLERVNRAIDHVIQGLDGPLQLDDLARVACFSPFHFHRVFAALVGETPAQFVKRLRLERALFLMSHDPGRSLTDVAMSCGFASSSDFSRSFKKHYGVPPSVVDLETLRDRRREDLQRLAAGTPYTLERLEPGANPDGFEARLVDPPARTVAYVRVPDPYHSETGVIDAAKHLEAWAEARGLADGQWLGYQWDDPEIVALEDCRYDVGLVVPDVRADGVIGRIEFPPMRVAQVEVRGDIDLEQRALDWLFSTWLPSSGYVPADQPCFEAWIGRPFAHGMEHFELYAHLPVER